MTQTPSTLRYALLEPAHIAWLVLAFFALIFFGFSLPVLAVAAAVELFYLLIFAQTVAYKRRVRLKAAGGLIADRDTALALRAAQLSRDDRRRYQAIDKLHRDVVERLGATGQGSALSSTNRDDIDQLKAAALEFCLAMQSLRQHLPRADARNQPIMQQQLTTLESQVQEIEQTLLGLLSPAQLPGGQKVGTLLQDVEATRRTLAEMKAFDLQ